MFEVPIIVGNMKAHSLIKTKVLNLIEQTEFKHLDSMREQITKTDWDRKKKEKQYLQPVIPHILEEAGEVFARMNYFKFDMDQTWFQQYEHTDFHEWHRHPGTDWGFVYYIELPEDGPATQFRNPLNLSNTYTPAVKEGQFVMFPSFIEHRSAENQSQGRKTVIVTNFTTL